MSGKEAGMGAERRQAHGGLKNRTDTKRAEPGNSLEKQHQV